MKERVSFRIEPSDIEALRTKEINAGPYVRKLIKLLISGEKLPKELQIDEDNTKWKLIRVKVRV